MMVDVMATITLDRLIKTYAKPHARRQLQSAADELIDMIGRQLEQRKGSILIFGLGTLRVVKVKSRKYRHPKTKEICEVGPKTVLRFKPSKQIHF